MNIQHRFILLSGALTHWGASAHEGHGMTAGSHWHSTDTLGFIVVGVLLVAAWAFGKRK